MSISHRWTQRGNSKWYDYVTVEPLRSVSSFSERFVHQQGKHEDVDLNGTQVDVCYTAIPFDWHTSSLVWVHIKALCRRRLLVILFGPFQHFQIRSGGVSQGAHGHWTEFSSGKWIFLFLHPSSAVAGIKVTHAVSLSVEDFSVSGGFSQACWLRSVRSCMQVAVEAV